jgi:hypothetical protein
MLMMLRCVVAVAAALLVIDRAAALPRFSSREGAKCQSCHVNPSGAGMRQAFGAQYGRETLPVPEWAADLELEDLTTAIASFVGVGVDVRTLYSYVQLPDTGSSPATNSNAFWQMQGDLYLNLKLAKKVNVYFEKGVYSGFELFGMVSLLPANGHVKAGKFVPNFGTRLDDHTAYIRRYTGFSPEFGRPELTGLEAGVSPGWFSAFAGVYNAEDGFGSAVGNSKAYLLRADGLFRLAEAMHLGLGANLFGTTTSGDVRQTLVGGMASFSAGEFTVFGEYDLIQTQHASGDVTGTVAYVEANYVVTPGVDLKVAYDFYDPDKDVKGGSMSRYSFGVEFFPVSGVEVRPMYRVVVEDPTNYSNNEFHIMLHFYL